MVLNNKIKNIIKLMWSTLGVRMVAYFFNHPELSSRCIQVDLDEKKNDNI